MKLMNRVRTTASTSYLEDRGEIAIHKPNMTWAGSSTRLLARWNYTLFLKQSKGKRDIDLTHP